MGDEGFRPEFMTQLESLRDKILKRVKPKTMDGRVCSGEMVLELVLAYTHAINDDRLPNIENAWASVS